MTNVLQFPGNGTLDDKVLDEMVDIAFLSDVVENYDEASKKPSQLSKLKQTALEVLLSEYRFDENATDEEKAVYLEARKEFRKELDSTDAYTMIAEALGTRVGSIKEYYDQNIDRIYQEIENKLNSDLAGIDNKGEAINAILYAFAPMFKKPDISQEQADQIKWGEMQQKAKFPYSTKEHPGIGNIEQATLSQYRLMTAKYVTEDKDGDGNVIGYKIDTDALKERVKASPIVGSILYNAEKPQEQQYANAA